MQHFFKSQRQIKSPAETNWTFYFIFVVPEQVTLGLPVRVSLYEQSLFGYSVLDDH